MAESSSNSNLENSKCTIPSNEELINSLVSDLEESILEKESSLEDLIKTNEKTSENKNCYINSNINVSGSAGTQDTFANDKGSESESEDKQDIPSLEDDLVDELALKDLEVTYTEEDKKRLHKEAEVFKQKGNDLFKLGEYRESALVYTQALRICPLAFHKERAILYSNRAASKMKLELNEAAIEDCSKALELDERYLKALYRRAQLYELTDKLDEALVDYTKILEIDPLHRDALYASKRLPDQIQERNEKLKTEMLGKLKDLGNMFLKPFGLSTENFQLAQDPNSGGYSINFKS